MFRMYDFDGNGLISKDEFIRMLRLVLQESWESGPEKELWGREGGHEGGSRR